MKTKEKTFSPAVPRSLKACGSVLVEKQHMNFSVSPSDVLISSAWQKAIHLNLPLSSAGPDLSLSQPRGEVLHTRRTSVQKQMTFYLLSIQRAG